jgi:hypothetical protein
MLQVQPHPTNLVRVNTFQPNSRICCTFTLYNKPPPCQAMIPPRDSHKLATRLWYWPGRLISFTTLSKIEIPSSHWSQGFHELTMHLPSWISSTQGSPFSNTYSLSTLPLPLIVSFQHAPTCGPVFSSLDMGILCSRVDHSCLWEASYFPLEKFPFFLLMSMHMSSVCSFMIPYPLSLCVCLFICLCICPLPSHSFSWTRTFPLSLGSPLPSFRSKLPGSSSQIKEKILGTFGRQLQPTLHSSL